MNYVFGKGFDFNIYTYENGDRIQSIPSQTVTSYLFTEQPSREIARAGTGAARTITHSHTTGNVLSVPVTDINDPDPASLTNYHVYWLAVNFILEADAQVQTVLRALKVERATGHDELIGVTAAKIVEAYPDVQSFLSPDQIESMIQLAQVDMLDDLKNKGFQWAEIYRPAELFNALLFKSLTYIHQSQIQRQGDRFFVSADASQRRYEGIISTLKISYDEAQAGTITQARTGGIIYSKR